MTQDAPAQDRLNKTGVEAICAAIADGSTMTALSMQVGVGFGTLHAWIAADPERSARVREARQVAAVRWDELAESRLDEAGDPFALAKAKELAHHYRWRASKIAPAQYGDKLQHAGPDGGPVQVRVVTGVPRAEDAVERAVGE